MTSHAPDTRYTPPRWHPGAVGRSLSNNRAGLVASLLPIALVLGAILFVVWPTHGTQSDDQVLWGYGTLFLVIGGATAFPACLMLRGLPDYKVDVLSIVTLAALFPMWGTVGIAAGLCVLAPFTCTGFWAISLSLVLARRRAWHFFLMQSGLTVGIAVPFVLIGWRWLDDPFTLPVVLAWHLAHPFALGLAAELRRSDLRHLRSVCHHCGYPREGLPSEAPCPECGLRHVGG